MGVLTRRHPAAISTTIAWGPLMPQADLPLTAESAAVVLAPVWRDDRRVHARSAISMAACGASPARSASGAGRSLNSCSGSNGKEADGAAVLPIQILIGLLISNGPGAENLRARCEVSADGPQTPGRVQINKAMVGFLTRQRIIPRRERGPPGQGMAFLLEQFKDVDLENPTDPRHGIDLKAMATRFAETYKAERRKRRDGASRNLGLLGAASPGSSKAKLVNFDPRERFIAEFMEKRGQYNIFHAFYCSLLRYLTTSGFSLRLLRQCGCDHCGVAAGCPLEGLPVWDSFGKGLGDSGLQRVPRWPHDGAAAEIDDHLNRGRNMDTRTPQKCSFIV